MKIAAITLLFVLVPPLSAWAQENDRKDESAAALQEALRTAVATNRKLAYQVDRLTAELAALRDEIKDVRGQIRFNLEKRDKLLSKVVRLTDELAQAKDVASRLQKRNEQLAGELAKGPPTPPLVGTPSPYEEEDDEPFDVEGIVTAVSRTGLVEISIGSDDGIREGTELHVFRKSQYVGRVTVLKTTPDRSIARTIKEFQKAEFQKGDRVSTKMESKPSGPIERPEESDPK
jgi:hypothetical protein